MPEHCFSKIKICQLKHNVEEDFNIYDEEKRQEIILCLSFNFLDNNPDSS